MIGSINGEVLFSDGHETIVQTMSGIGYQVYCPKVLAEGSHVFLYISHVIKEASEELYGFSSLREKKLFELLITVKGVGPKSAFSLMGALGAHNIVEGIMLENKKVLTKAPGVGAKAAAQIILDLSGKITKIKMYSDSYVQNAEQPSTAVTHMPVQPELRAAAYVEPEVSSDHQILSDALMACKELGFKEDNIIPIAQKILNENKITKPEQLVHLVLKEV